MPCLEPIPAHCQAASTSVADTMFELERGAESVTEWVGLTETEGNREGVPVETCSETPLFKSLLMDRDGIEPGFPPCHAHQCAGE